MNVALIFAGGTGQRMNSRSKPKQFLELHGKPILMYTLEFFEDNQDIDAICIVYLEGWKQKVEQLLEQYDIHKVHWMVSGGKTGHDSIYKGLAAIKEECVDQDIILIHDGVRPLISSELITECMKVVKRCGNAITVDKVAESVVEVNDAGDIISVPPRDAMRLAKAPQGFFFQDIWKYYEKAQMDGFKAIDSAHLMSHYGQKIHTVDSTPYNIKLATPSDYYVFRALYEVQENQQIFGL